MRPNLDGIKLHNSGKKTVKKIFGPVVHSHVVLPFKFEDITLRRAVKLSKPITPAQADVSDKFSGKNLWKFYQQKYVLAALVLALVSAFGGGMWFALNTPRSRADIEPPAVQPQTYRIILTDVLVNTAQTSNISNDVLFNTPLEMLPQYLSPPPLAADIRNIRTDKLVAYLKARGSPLEAEARTIASQEHWKLILAISFAESTLGKRCYFNNCSGIGGSKIKTYDSLKSWILDFNRLLEKRYKDKTLEQMCGVYVQPCNPNWLLATKQILSDLQANEIQ